MPSATRTRTGTDGELNGGQNMIHAVVRTNARENPTRVVREEIDLHQAVPVAVSRSISCGAAGHQLVAERDHLVEHPRSGDRDDDGGTDQLGDERQGLFLQLGDRLDQPDDESDHQHDDEEGSGDLGGEDEGVGADVDGVCEVMSVPAVEGRRGRRSRRASRTR